MVSIGLGRWTKLKYRAISTIMIRVINRISDIGRIDLKSGTVCNQCSDKSTLSIDSHADAIDVSIFGVIIQTIWKGWMYIKGSKVLGTKQYDVGDIAGMNGRKT